MGLNFSQLLEFEIVVLPLGAPRKVRANVSHHVFKVFGQLQARITRHKVSCVAPAFLAKEVRLFSFQQCGHRVMAAKHDIAGVRAKASHVGLVKSCFFKHQVDDGN